VTDPVRFEPAPSAMTTPFWDATRDQVLLLPWCIACERPHWYPRRRCPHCRAAGSQWRPSAGEGTVEAISVQHRPGWPGLADRVPYPVILVRLDEGVRLLSSMPVGDAGGPASVGDRVHLAWEPLSDGRSLPLFAI
jgi:uncharacterized OB-fold protein